MFKFFNKFIGDSNEQALKDIQPIVDEINDLESDFEKLSDEELKGVTADFRSRWEAGKASTIFCLRLLQPFARLHDEQSVCDRSMCR